MRISLKIWSLIFMIIGCLFMFASCFDTFFETSIGYVNFNMVIATIFVLNGGVIAIIDIKIRDLS